MAIQLLSNLNYPIGNIINQELQNATSAKIAVAFLKYSGLKVIEQSLNHCLGNKGNVEIIAGLDFKTTDPQSMHYLINLQKQVPNFIVMVIRTKIEMILFFIPKFIFLKRGGKQQGLSAAQTSQEVDYSLILK